MPFLLSDDSDNIETCSESVSIIAHQSVNVSCVLASEQWDFVECLRTRLLLCQLFAWSTLKSLSFYSPTPWDIQIWDESDFANTFLVEISSRSKPNATLSIEIWIFLMAYALLQGRDLISLYPETDGQSSVVDSWCESRLWRTTMHTQPLTKLTNLIQQSRFYSADTLNKMVDQYKLGFQPKYGG